MKIKIGAYSSVVGGGVHIHEDDGRFAGQPDSWDYFQGAEIAMLALLPAEPCGTKSAENVTQAGLCQFNARPRLARKAAQNE